MPRHRHPHAREDEVAADADDYYEEDAQPRGNQKPQAKEVEERLDVDPEYHGLIIGPRGETIKNLEDETMCYIDVPKANSRGERKDPAIWIAGVKADVEYAKKRIRELVAEKKLQDAGKRSAAGALAPTAKNEAAFPALDGNKIVTLAVDVEKFAHGKVIGRQGARLRELKERLREKEGSASTLNTHVGVEVIVPEREDPSSIITVHVPAYLAKRGEEIIRDFLRYYELERHLLKITLIDDASMAGDSASKGQKVPSSPAPRGTPKTSATAAAAKPSAPAATAKRASPATVLHVDPAAEATAAAAAPVVLGTQPDVTHVRKPRFRPVRGPPVDRALTSAYVHAVLSARPPIQWV